MRFLVRRRPRTWVLEAPRCEPWGAGTTVRCTWSHGAFTFRSATHRLEPSGEAFAGLLLLPALQRGAVLRVEAALDPVWLAGQRRLVEQWRRWWGGRRGFALEADAGGSASDLALRPRGAGLCFTGGVDSFHALLEDPGTFTHLVYVRGYDVPPDDVRRYEDVRRSLETVSRGTGKDLVLVESDLRRDPTFRRVSWDRTHGGALAAVGHLLGGHLASLTLGPSWRHGELRPWGTHPGTDPCWSTSGVRIRSGAADRTRDERLRRIAGNPLVLENLRVCWENRSPTGNCGRCEKCVRTMVALAGLGSLDRCRTFEVSAAGLADVVDGLPAIPPGFESVWTDMLVLDLPPGLRAAVERLLDRGAG